MPMVWYVPPLSPVVDVVERHGLRRRGPRQPVRRDRRAADPGRVPRRAVHRRRHRPRRRACSSKLAAMRAYMRDINLGRDAATPSIPAAVGHDRGDDLRDVPPAGDREVRRALRHPHRPRRAGARARGARLLASTSTAGRACTSPDRSARRAVGPAPVAVETFQRPQAAPDVRHGDVDDRPGDLAAGSTCSTGTARALPPGLFPPRHGRRRAVIGLRRRPTAGRDDRVVHLVAARCLDYPPPSSSPGSRVREALRSTATHPPRLRCEPPATTSTETAWRRSSRHYVDTFDLSRKHALYLSYWTDGDTRRRGEVLGRFKTAYRSSGSRRRHPRGAARPPPDGAGVRGTRRPRGRRRAAPGLPRRASSCCASPCRRRRARMPTRVVAVCATLPGRVATRSRGCHGDGRDDRAAPDGVGRPRALRPEAAAAATGLVRCRRSGARAMSTFLWGVLPYLCLATLVGRAPSGATATTSSAGPPARPSSTSRGCCASARRSSTSACSLVFVGHVGGLVIPESWTEAVGVSEGLYHFNALLFGGLAGVCTLVGIAHPRLPPPHRRPGLHGHDEERQG